LILNKSNVLFRIMFRSLLTKFTPSLYTSASSSYRSKYRPSIYKIFGLGKGVLVYVGGNHGESLFDIAHQYKRVIVFECNPFLFQALKSRFRNFSNVEVYEFAASDCYGTATLSIPDNGNYFGSSTILGFAKNSEVQESASFTVAKINLGEFLKFIGIQVIDFYVSDIEGADYAALSSMSELIQMGRIKRLQIEVWSEENPRPFKNQTEKIFESDFQNLLGTRYLKIQEGTSSFSNDHWEVINNWKSKDILWEFR
jgi:FkbM family methyltransferase